MLDVCLLGTGGMQPLPNRRLSATLVRAGRSLILLDCGEGTQVAVRERGWGLRNLTTILLTHMHADHVLGLPGLLLTLANAGKDASEPLTIYGPEPLAEVVRGLLVVAPHLPYPLQLVTLTGGETVAPPGVDGVTVGSLPLDHAVPCLAYVLHAPRAPRFDAPRARALGIPVPLWRRLQHGESVEHGGRTVAAEEVRGPARRGLRLVLATDTRPTPGLVTLLRGDGAGTDLFICDGMYGDPSEASKRWEVQHMTFAEAATLARDGGARHLWLTHFSPALSDPAACREQAAAIFPNTTVGHDGLTETLAFED